MPPKKARSKKVFGTEVRNIYLEMDKDLIMKAPNPNFDIHNFEIPFYAVVVAPSGSGKTNFIYNLIERFSEGEGTFQSINIVTRNKDEALYHWLQRSCPGIQIDEGMHNLPDLDEFDKNFNHLVIVDDLVLDKNQRTICDFYIRARKLNVSVMYLSQKYFEIPIMIRANCRYLILMKIRGLRDVSLKLKEVSVGVSKEELMQIYKLCTKNKLQPMIIDMDSSNPNKTFRKGFLEYIHVEDEDEDED